MRILFLSWNFPPALGGIEYVAENLFEGLRGAGQDVRLITSHARGAAEAEDVHRATRSGVFGFLWFALWRGARLCRTRRPDVLLCASVVAAPVGVLLSTVFRRPCVVMVHGSDALHPGWVYQRAVRFLFRRAQRLSANSDQTRRILIEAGIDPERIDVVHPGVDVERFASRPDQDAAALIDDLDRRPVLLSVGRLIKRKGLLEFVRDVMPALVRDVPDVVLLIVGEDATQSLAHTERMHDRIEDAIRVGGLERHVRLLGGLPEADLVRLLYRADLFVLPCLDLPGDIEGFGIVFLEAALAGTASVATRVGGIPEAVIDGETGLLVEPGDAEGLRACITRLLRDDDLRHRLASAGGDRARAEFGWDTIVNQYIGVLARCANADGSAEDRRREDHAA